MKIWTIDDTLIDKLVDSYIDYVTNPYSFRRQTSSWKNKSIGNPDLKPEKRALKYDRTFRARMNCEEGQTPVTVMNLPMPQKLHTRAHFISIIHQLYIRQLDSEIGEIVLNSTILQKINRHYNYMLEVICKELNIYKSRESVGEFARNVYYMNYSIKFKYIECINKIVLYDLKKVSREFQHIHRIEIDKAKKLTSPQFIKNYNKSLRYFKIKNIEAAKRFIENNKNIKNINKIKSKYYYENILNKISKNQFKEIDRADSNGRIYHIVTRLPKTIRQFSNIKYIIDTKNSHPLLFNYYILEYFFNKNNINIYTKNNHNYNNKLYSIISFFIIKYYKQYTYYYFSKKLCNELKNNGYGRGEIEIIKGIKSDVWAYLYTTSIGKLWDNINQANPEFTRDDIKHEMFKSLFYSYSKIITKDKIYAKAFQLRYPTIAKIIRHYKITYHNQCQEQNLFVYKRGKKKDKIQLAHKLMQIESEIFQKILPRLFKIEGFIGVGIHDAIAVFDESSVTPDVVKDVMEKIYFEFGLCPTFSIEGSDADCETLYTNTEEEEDQLL